MEFARAGENMIERLDELKGAEIRLYLIILFHTWTTSPYCRLTLREICETWGLKYNHSATRLKELRKKGWCAGTVNKIRPVIVVPTSNKTASKKSSPKIGLGQSKNWTKSSPKIGADPVQKLDSPLKDLNTEFLNRDLNTQTANGVGENFDSGKSIFSLEECIRYAEVCKTAGEDIKSPLALGKNIWLSGQFDSFIQSILYPEQPAASAVSDELREGLELLLDVQAKGEDVTEYKHWYTEEDWQWLMSELAK